MSRRDTIIIAALVNAGLLIVLFATALKSNVPGQEFAVNAPPVIQEASELAVKKETAAHPRDEVDYALHQYAQSAAAVEPAPLAAAEPSPQAASFADDLKTFTLPQPVAAPAIAVSQEKNTPDFVEVKVKKGDVLEKIARHHHTSVTEIMQVNRLTNTNLRIGQVLKVPTSSVKTSAPAAKPAAPAAEIASGDPKYYIVKKGDNPWTIAVKNHMKVEDLLKMNDMTQEQARRLKPGDQLRIR